MSDLRHREDLLYTFEKIVSTEGDLIRFYVALCEINRADKTYHCYRAKYRYGPKNGPFDTRRPTSQMKYKSFEQFIDEKYRLDKNLSDISFSKYLTYDEKQFFIYHKNAIARRYHEFLGILETAQTDVNSNNYRAIDIYKLWGNKVYDRTMPKEDAHLEKDPLYSKKVRRIILNEFKDRLGGYLLFTSLAIIGLIVVFVCDDEAVKGIGAGVMAFAYFLITADSINIIADKFISKEDKSNNTGCLLQIFLSLIPAILIFVAGANYQNTDTSTSSVIDGFDDDYNRSLKDDYLKGYDKVYITTSGDGGCYHVNVNCISLSRSIDIEQVTKSEALSRGLAPCHNCTAR